MKSVWRPFKDNAIRFICGILTQAVTDYKNRPSGTRSLDFEDAEYFLAGAEFETLCDLANQLSGSSILDHDVIRSRLKIQPRLKE